MKLSPYVSYKPTGSDWLGFIPTEWEKLSFGKVITFIRNGCSSTQIDEAEETVMVTRIESISGGRINNSKVGFIAKTGSVEKYRLRKGDIQLSNINSLNIIGNCAIVESDEEIYAGMNLLHIRLKTNKVMPKYVWYQLRSPMFRERIEANAKPAINQASIPASSLKQFGLICPPKDQQTKIATFLDRETAKIDLLIEKQQRLIELLEEKRQAVISHAVTKGLNPYARMKDSGVEWLGEVPAHWEVKQLKRLIKSLESGVSVNATDIPATTSEYGVLKTSCVYTRFFRPEENKTVFEEEVGRLKCPVRAGSIIISRMNTPDLVGASAYIELKHENLFLPDRLWQTVFDNSMMVNAEYLSYFMMIKSFRDQISIYAAGTSSSMQNISQEDYLSIPVCFPTLDEQKQIVNYIKEQLEKLDSLRSKASKAVELLKERRTALISAAVTGKIDVRDQVPQDVEEAVAS